MSELSGKQANKFGKRMLKIESEIESKRKELEDDTSISKDEKDLFDLGVQMGKDEARKEIFDKLLEKAKEHDDTEHEGEYYNPDCNQSFTDLIFKLKQSLEDKHG